MKQVPSSILASVALLLLASQAQAEYRTVLIQLKQDKDGKMSVTIHSDDKKDQRSAVTTDEAVKAISGMTGWGSAVGVYVVPHGVTRRDDVKKVLDAVFQNMWLDLIYYGHEVPRGIADHFLKNAGKKQ